jgi:hypothetical protein
MEVKNSKWFMKPLMAAPFSIMESKVKSGALDDISMPMAL